MANEYLVNSADLTAVADAIREKGGTADELVFPAGFINAVEAIQSGGGGSAPSTEECDVNFYDYDGTLLFSYTLDEAHALTALPDAPTHDGLTFQGWNFSLEKVKAATRKMDVGAMYITSDGKTRIFIRLEEGRTSPMLGVCPNGTVDVDWGDGTAHDTLTGTSASTVKWTPTHEYAAPGEYVIALTVDGQMTFSGKQSTNQYSYVLRHDSGTDARNRAYQNAVRAVYIGDSGTSIGSNAFTSSCNSLSNVVIPSSVTSIGGAAFNGCNSLRSVVIPSSVTSIGSSAFASCNSLSNVVIPPSVTSIAAYAFNKCNSLRSVIIPDGMMSISNNMFEGCYSLRNVSIPDSVTNIGNNAFATCYSLSTAVIPSSVTSIGSSAFSSCYGIRVYDFTKHTFVPTLSNTNALSGIADDCEIRVPSSLYDEWIAATNWATYASYIVAV